MRRVPEVLCAAIVGIVPVAPLFGQCVVNISTGFDQGAGAVLAEGVSDDDYTVDSGGGPQPALTGGATTGFPVPIWFDNDDRSLWISSTANSSDAQGMYTYETRFDVAPEIDAAELAIVGQWSVDDTGTDVEINGTSTGIMAAGFGGFTAFPPGAGLGLFTSGTNVIRFHVENGAEGPTGLRVDACVDLGAPEEREVDISTGFDQEDLELLGDGEPDADYLLTGPPGSGIGPGPAIASASCPIPPWVANDIQSRWVSNATCVGPAGDYVYRVEVELGEGIDPPVSRLLGGFSADNGVSDILINGISTGIASTVGFDAFTPFPPNAGKDLFQSGLNSIEFVVENAGEDPTGLRVDGEVDVCPVPPPGSVVVNSVFSIDTGFSQEAASTIANGELDDNYELVGPAGTGICRKVATVINDDAFPIGPWLASSAQSKWVGPQADSNGPPGVYTYRIRLSIPDGVDPAPLRLIGGWSSDNPGLDIVVNGVSTGVSNDGNFTILHAFPPDAGLGLFQEGENVVDFLVDNLPPGTGPTGLRVEGVVGAGTDEEDLSTGIGPRGIGPVGAGVPDARYIIAEHVPLPPGVGNGAPPAPATVVAEDGFPIPPWVANSFGSKWVGLDGEDSIGEAGSYFFEATFTVAPQYNPHKLVVAGGWGAAGSGVEALLNGASIRGEAAGFESLTPFPEGAGLGLFQAGANTLRFAVENDAQGPTGLRVDARYEAVQQVNPLDISTGFDQTTATVLAEGDPDDQYVVVGPLDPAPAVVVSGPPVPPWIVNTATSGWIGVPGAGADAPPGEYRYRTTVTLTAAQEGQATLVGSWASDDSATVEINGAATGLMNGGFIAMSVFPDDAGLSLFREGENIIEFVVTNGGLEDNPHGLRVDAVVSVPEGGRQVPGDCNQDRAVDLSDAVCIFGVLFLGDPKFFPCGDGMATSSGNLSLLDWQPDGGVDLSDGVGLLQFLFQGGPAHALAVPGMETEGCVLLADCPDNTACP